MHLSDLKPVLVIYPLIAYTGSGQVGKTACPLNITLWAQKHYSHEKFDHQADLENTQGWIDLLFSHYL